MLSNKFRNLSKPSMVNCQFNTDIISKPSGLMSALYKAKDF